MIKAVVGGWGWQMDSEQGGSGGSEGEDGGGWFSVGSIQTTNRVEKAGRDREDMTQELQTRCRKIPTPPCVCV